MIGALRVSGRWVSQEVLERLSRRAQGPEAPPRQQLIQEFCQAIHWRDRKGRWSVSSASVALRRLEARGQVRLPPIAPRAKTARPRGLVDDGQPLPPLPQLILGGRVRGLRLHLVTDEADANHWIWNRLIVRGHPLGRAPLVGAQLRYLVESDQGLVGAFGFGPAAYHLECRDLWIGWDPPAREQNRVKVIGLSRFLIRPGVKAPHLASQCYGLVLRQVAQDWCQRYGIKPVLVETYVDRERHQGRSLGAANWQRLGQSKGRGRDDRGRLQEKSPKDVWVYELDRRARAQLQVRSVPAVAPRSVFAPALREPWAQEERAGVDLGDERLNRRVARMLMGRWSRPQNSFYLSFDNKAESKGAYELVENPRDPIGLESLLAPHRQQTARRMAAEKVVLAIQDTTTLSYNSLPETEGLGPVGDGGRGLLLHSLQAFRLDGIPLGTAWVDLWAREEQSDTAQRNQQSIEDKESARWVRALQAASQLARPMPQTQVVVCGDRESDIYELFDQEGLGPKNLHALVRGQHDRCLSDGRRLLATLESMPVGGTMKVAVPRRTGRPARTATLELRWKEVEMAPPATGMKTTWAKIKVGALLAREVGAPPGAEPIDWVLLSTWPITTLKMARRMVRWYAVRWSIECWHRVLKEVCGVERRQMKSARALERSLALDMIVASRALLLNRLGKEHPQLPADLFYSPDELEVLAVKKKETGQYPQTQTLSVLQANTLTAMLAGFWARPSDGHPGAKILAEGLKLLQAMVWYKEHQAKSPSQRRARRAAT